MGAVPPDHRHELLARARAGDKSCLGELLEFYGNYLALVARTQIRLQLSARGERTGRLPVLEEDW